MFLAFVKSCISIVAEPANRLTKSPIRVSKSLTFLDEAESFMRSFNPLSLAVAVSALSLSPALAQATPEAGICGQPPALTAAALTIDAQPAGVTGEFVELARNEPRYIELTIGAAVDLTMATDTSKADTTLVLFNAQGQVVASDDDGGGDTNSRIVAALQPGAYCLQVDQIGALDAPGAIVPVSISGAPGPDACVKQAEAPVEIGPDSDEIITSDTLQGSAHLAMNIKAGTGVTIQAQSPIFDTYLKLEDRVGQIVAEDDDGGGDTNSKLELAPVAEDGLYCVTLTGLSDEGGLYALSVIPNTGTAAE